MQLHQDFSVRQLLFPHHKFGYFVLKITLGTIIVLALTLPLISCQTADLKQIALGQNVPTSPPKKVQSPPPSPAPQTQAKTTWASFLKDGLHDPEGPAFEILQRPSEALAAFPKDAVGNRVNWVKALNQGHITPRTNIFPDTEISVLDLDIFLDLNGALPIVKFPHRQHTQWLDCSNCHDRIFKMEAGGTQFTMNDILEGNYCGQCHGAVAFPLTECQRCHSVSHKDFQKVLAATKNKAIAKPQLGKPQ